MIQQNINSYMHMFKTTLMSSRFSLGIFVFMLTCSLFDTSYASLSSLSDEVKFSRSRIIPPSETPPSDVMYLIKKYKTAKGTEDEEAAARALAYHKRYMNQDTSINYDLIRKDLNSI